MAVDMFLKIGDIKGESTDDKHKDEIEVMSYSWGLSQSGTLAFGGGAGAGKVQFQDFHFTSSLSKASPLLFLGCATGEHIKDAVLTARRSGEERQEFLVIKMNDILISSYQTGGSSGSDAVPTDSFSLNFAKVEYAYTPFDETGKPGQTVTAGWDLKLNKKI